MTTTRSGMTLEQIAERLDAVSHRNPNELDAHLIAVDSPRAMDGCSAALRCHLFALDGAGRHKHKHLASYLVDRTLDFAIPRGEIQRAKAEDERSGRNRHMKRLAKDADGLFARVKKSGEGGELLLYALADVLLGVPQLLCKMPLKTSDKMHVHGTDGIHVTVDRETDKLAVYWGESKLYKSMSSAISECFTSVAPFLLDDGPTGSTRRDLALMRTHVDFDDPKLEAALKSYLDPDDPNFNQMEPRAVCLVGFDETSYPDPFDDEQVGKLTAEMTKLLDKWSKAVSKALVKNKIDGFTIEVFFVPFPSVEEFREAFLQALGVPDVA